MKIANPPPPFKRGLGGFDRLGHSNLTLEASLGFGFVISDLG
jgi:hypothetical protein